MRRFKGFTLTELMIALAVIGIIVAVVTPAIMRTRPNKNKMMVKKTFYTTENIIATLINDESLYPDMREACYEKDPDGGMKNDCYWGFDYKKEATFEGNSYSDDNKFPKLFLAHLNCQEYDDSGYACTTTDGVYWDLSETVETAFDPGQESVDQTNEYEIKIDVNGKNEGPNEVEEDSSTDDFDRYRIEVKVNGKLYVNSDDATAVKWVTINSSIRDE